MRKQLLVIDDDPLFIDFAGEVLATGAIDVISAPNGKAALPLIARALPSFIISDFEMPEMNGVELHAHLAGDPRTRDIPFFFITGSSNDALLQYAAEHGIRVFSKYNLVSELKALLDLLETFPPISPGASS